MEEVSLALLKSGEEGMVTAINGGKGLVRKLEALGIRPGARIAKLSGQLMHGPVLVKIGRTQVAIGYGMARKIIVELKREISRSRL